MSEAEKYEVLEKIGHGSFGVIRKVRRKTDGHVLCRKEINYIRMSQKEREQLHAEFSILNSLEHPNIVGYYHREHLKATQDLHLYMEYCGNGDLGRVIKDLKAKHQYAEEEFVWSIFSQLVTALYRCHYGVDPPSVGRNVMGLGGPEAKQPKTVGGKPKVMILHRDLKPENVFLGEDNSVKLGDFGLSKVMQSHDFASTYVGTPFYMSPEICAAERYTLHSDIWSLGCIMYELCAKEPPFNARTHFHLVQKIKDGKFAPIPNIYSPELSSVIKSCLKVNPSLRPDTAALLNLPVVRLMRKEREVVDLGRMIKSKEELLALKGKEMEDGLLRLDAEKGRVRNEIESTVRREWELKARLEIDRQVKLEIERLQKTFDAEVQDRVKAALQKQLPGDDESEKPSRESASESDIPCSSVSTNGETDFPSSTDLTDLTSLSLESPTATQAKQPAKKAARTPFSRSRTMFDGSPMEIVEPSPMSIASLSLSPRRNGKAPSTARNIFAEQKAMPIPAILDDEDDDDLPPLPSPTRHKSAKNPFQAAGRPPLISQRTAPAQKASSQTNIFAVASSSAKPPSHRSHLPSGYSQPDLRSDLGPTNKSPNRRLSKIPASTADTGSPVRKAKKPPLFGATAATTATTSDDMFKAVMKKEMMKGRTLVELAQARAGGRPVTAPDSSDGDSDAAARARKRQTIGELAGANGPARAEREVLWDPERDEMPSPFLVRGSKGIRGL